ncbi:unnamed protein product [Rotaria sp. Silwood2]|nr:unnamed protein product [Rotaria sp. Silwood2]
MSWIDPNLNLNGIWTTILENLEHIYRAQGMSPTSYMELYTVVYEYCTNSQPQSGGSQITRRSTQNNRQNNPHDKKNVVGEELYNKLKNYLKNYLKEIVEMAMEIWKLVFFQPLQSQVTSACLQLINAERQNEIINTRFIRAVVQIELDFNEDSFLPRFIHQMTSPTLEIYKDYFEVPFLQYTEQFYRQEAANFLIHNSMTKYLKKIEQRFQEETYRVQSYLHPSTLEPLMKNLERILIHEQVEEIYTQAKALLHDENYSVGRIPNAKVELKKIFENNFRPKGIESMERISATAIDNPKLYVEKILDIHEKFFKVAQKVFNNDEHLRDFFNKISRNFINNNAVTEAANNARKSAELLARYCDILLRKRSKVVEETDLEEKFNQIMVLFFYFIIPIFCVFTLGGI